MKYLADRGGKLQYTRRVPSDLVDLVGSQWVRKSLKTSDHELAAQRIKQINQATERYWEALRLSGASEAAATNYVVAIQMTRTMGLSYSPMQDLIDANDRADITRRLALVREKGVEKLRRKP